jgi:NAD-dependent DNA ligase
MSLPEKFERWLEAAYCYYVLGESDMPDTAWDLLGRELAAQWDDWEHADKHLARKDEMFTGYYLQFVYPEWVKEKHA